MQLTRAADYAVRVMIHLATLPLGTRVSRDTLAMATEIPIHFFSKVLQVLARARLIAVHRGASGGFALALPAEQVSVLRVGRRSKVPSLSTFVPCMAPVAAAKDWCPAHLVWLEAQAALTQVLKNASIGKLAGHAALPRQGKPDKVVYPWN